MTTPLQVLVLEDLASDAELMIHQLRQSGFDPFWQRVDSQADYLVQLHPDLDLILADYTLPQFDAMRALRLLQDRALDIPLIVITGSISEEAAVECMKLGAADYLLKDRLTRLGEAVRHALEQKKLRLDRQRADDEVRRRNRELTLLNRVTSAVASSLDLQTILDITCRELASALSLPLSGAVLLDEPSTEVRCVAACVPPGIPDVIGITLPLLPFKITTGGRAVLENKQPFVIEDAQQDPDLAQAQHILGLLGVCSLLIIPVLVREKVMGVIGVADNKPHSFSDDEISLSMSVATTVSQALHNAQLYSELEAQSQRLELAVDERTAELRAANEHLKALSRVKDEFVSNVSHELRTPITSIKLYLDLVKNNPVKFAVYLDTLTRETARLERTIEDLLSLSRMDQDRVLVRSHPVDLNELARAYVSDRGLLAEHKGLTLMMDDHRSDTILVEGDITLLGQALSVLLTNALAYAPSGGVVKVAAYPMDVDGKRWGVVSVSDNGPGIPLEEQPRLFERFFRGKASQSSGTQGTGLGLAIAQEIVRLHHGKLEVESAGKPGKGSTFSIRLPSVVKTDSQ